MDIIPEAIEQYLEEHSATASGLLGQLNDTTWRRILNPRMCSGTYQGRILSMISKLCRPRRILEIGTFTGYSALCLAEGLREGGELITVDKNEELEDFAKSFFAQSEHGQKIKMVSGDAMQVLPTLKGMFDLIFIDADKANYIHYFNLVVDKVEKGGVILSDNVLWSGKVVEPVKGSDRDTQTILEYNRILASDPRVETVMLPVRDGLSVSRRL